MNKLFFIITRIWSKLMVIFKLVLILIHQNKTNHNKIFYHNKRNLINFKNKILNILIIKNKSYKLPFIIICFSAKYIFKKITYM